MAETNGRAFERVYANLNKAQKLAVDQIDGPVLVIAGPGTGKTQLLGARVANILQKTDTLPQNILCLTFTENGAENMRERLARFIGQAAYDVNIGTYHAFGGDLIRRFPEYFAETRLQEPIDELSKRQVFINILDNLSYNNPLKQTRHHIGDVISTVSEVKRALLNAKDLRAISAENALFIINASEQISGIFDGFTRMPAKLDKAAPYFDELLDKLRSFVPRHPGLDPGSSNNIVAVGHNPSSWIPNQSPTGIENKVGKDGEWMQQIKPLAQISVSELSAALEAARDAGKTTPLTAWKNKWLAKDSENRFIFAGELENRRINALADVLKKYQKELEAHGWYDFDDMIIRAIGALEKNADLRFTLQEQYLYLLLDEYQDTNAAQAKLVQLLTENPVNEDRPNVMAVGDDDQAIYAFQGAQYSNMLDFYKSYRDVTVVNLTENYRSRKEILVTAQNISSQIEARLQQNLSGVNKILTQANTKLPEAKISRNEFLSNIAQYDFIAKQIKKLIAQGTSPREIAVLAPKHKYLEPLVPYLQALDVTVAYEKRENILDAPVVRQLITMSRLVLALGSNDVNLANALWPVVLSYDFWQIPTSKIWQISWQSESSQNTKLAKSLSVRDQTSWNWSRALLESDNEPCRNAALLFLTLAGKVADETCEVMLDFLIGSEPADPREPDGGLIRSPLRNYYTNSTVQTSRPEIFYETLSHLTVLRAKLRQYQATQESALRLSDLLNFVAMYEDADERMQSTSPYNQQADAVQLMTVYKAKGLEFEHVFLPCCHDDVWGSSARDNSNKLTLPANLAPIRHAGATDDERLRILFVAITRAKFGLNLASFANNYSGKRTRHVKYFDEAEDADGVYRAKLLPKKFQRIIIDNGEPPARELLEIDWRRRHVAGLENSRLQGLLANRLRHYQLSPTHLNTFIDMEYGGPLTFFFDVLLRFPKAPSASGQFGNAIHETLEWFQHTADNGVKPSAGAAASYFTRLMKSKKLTVQQTELEVERGKKALRSYLARRGDIFKPGDKAEHNFRREGAFAGDIHLSGKIDRMEIDQASKTITVVDFKTGKSFAAWESRGNLHKYRQQLYCYKLLIERSHTFAGYTVRQGRLEFIEPDAYGRINVLPLEFNDAEMRRTLQLLQAMWQHVKTLNFPTTNLYPPTIAGIKQFEKDLLEGTI